MRCQANMNQLVLLALVLAPWTALAVGEQKPLGVKAQEKAKGWFSMAKAYVPTAMPTVPGLTAPSVPRVTRLPLDEAVAKVAGRKSYPVTLDNWDTIIAPPASTSPKAPPNEWMIFVTGGNTTCGGFCHNPEVHWNETVGIMSADVTAPKLGFLNCERERILCTMLNAKPPTIWYVQRRNTAAGLPTDIHINYLNISNTHPADMIALHTNKDYERGMKFVGAFHPFDGVLAQTGLLKPVGYLFFAFGLLPSWTLMLVISMATRTYMSRRTQGQMREEEAAIRARRQQQALAAEAAKKK